MTTAAPREPVAAPAVMFHRQLDEVFHLG